jgi:hypothetical protein
MIFLLELCGLRDCSDSPRMVNRRQEVKCRKACGSMRRNYRPPASLNDRKPGSVRMLRGFEPQPKCA